MKQQKQSGFAHLMIIIVILGLGLVGTLGYVFYQNFMQPKIATKAGNSTSATNTTDKAGVTKTISYKTYTADKYNMSFKYPDTWSIHLKYNDYLKFNQEVDVQNENGVVVAELNLAALGVGGVCPDESARANTTVGVEAASVKVINAVYFSSMIVNNNDGTYGVRYGLSDNYTKNGENGKGCIFAFNFAVKDDLYGSYVAFADGYPDSKTDRKFNSNNEATQYIDSNSEYQEIKKMILSLSN